MIRRKMPILQATNLCFEREGRLFFNRLNFALAEGEILQITGSNGAGKTTMLRILSGLLLPNNGEIFWRGQTIYNFREAYLNELAFIGHHNAIKAQLTVHSNLKLGCYHRKIAQKLIYETLALVGLANYAEFPTYYLSAGQQRKLALARLFINPAKLWILDEPFTTIDFSGKCLIEKRLQNHLAQGGLIIITTHQPFEIQGVTVKKLDLDR